MEGFTVNDLILRSAAVASAALLVTTSVHAAVLDFEGGIGYAPVEDQAITPTTFNAWGVSILGPLSFESTGGGPFEFPPVSTEGFVTTKGTVATGDDEYDVDTDPFADLDGWFLRETDAFATPADPLFVINWLRTPKGPVSAEIWDIDVGTNPDNTESWEVIATYAGGGTATETSPAPLPGTDPTSLDGKAWSFSFSEELNGNALESLAFRFTGGKRQNLGVAFDNFETGLEPIPLPASGWMMLAALGGAAAYARKRKPAA